MKIVALNGLLGYGYSEEALHKAFEIPPDYVGVDAGSTDPGPYYLGAGKSFTDRAAVKRDLELALPLALGCGAPFIVGTAGGAGSAVHLRWLREILDEIAAEQKLSFRLAEIYTDVTAEYALSKLREGKLRPMGPQLHADEETVGSCVRIVSQVGSDPFIAALKNGAQVILCGRACDTAIYAAPCLLHEYDPGLSYHMAKIMECGAMCAEPVAAADVMQAVIERDWFELTPAHPDRRCTVDRVAAHTMYEQANPYQIHEPDGTADLRGCEFTQVSPRTVRVSGSRFIPSRQPTLKLEGVARAGFRTICMSEIKDPETIARIDSIFSGALKFTQENLRGSISPERYSVTMRTFGSALSGGMGVLLDCIGDTEKTAGTVCALMRSRMLHFDYPGRKSTAGNLAFPFSPSDIPAGEVYRFALYHLAEADDLCETAVTHYYTFKEGIPHDDKNAV